MSRINLLEETIETLGRIGLTPADVKWVGSRSGRFAIDWVDFARIANQEYDNGYGGNEVVSDLVVVGTDWWLERGEYDGSEWWMYKRSPVLAADPAPFSRVFVECYEYSIEELEQRYGKDEQNCDV